MTKGWPGGNVKRQEEAGSVVRVWVILVGFIAVLGLAVLFLRSNYPPELRSGASAPADKSGGLPAVRFKDVTTESGIRFEHYNGATGEKLLPETMGGGVAFFDCEGDGDQDLVFVNGTDWSWTESKRGPRFSIALYLNDGRGHFEEATAGSGLEVSFYGMGVACGDYDGDGLTDLFFTGVHGNRLFRNLGAGRFEETTGSAGVGGDGAWSTGAAWMDHDLDGDLDLFVCNYVRWSRDFDHEVDYRLPGLGRSYGPPVKFPGSYPYFYRNEGKGVFREVSQESGLRVRIPGNGGALAKSLAVAPVDIDRDGWIDLVVANDTVQNFLFLNRKNGTFVEAGARHGLAFDAFGQTRGAMGIDSARFRNDDALGIAIGNFANEMNSLYVSQRETTLFADEAVAEGLGPASRQLLKFGLFFFDFDLDGRLDVLTSNGHLDELVERLDSGQRYRQPAQLFWNRGGARGGRFVPILPSGREEGLFRPIVGRGSAYADIDGDGDLDVVLTQIGGPALLLRNEQSAGNHWVRIRLRGLGGNREAIGAWVTIRVGGQEMARQVMPTKSYLSQSELPITLGLGKFERIDSVQVRWPSGQVRKLEGVPAGVATTVDHP